MPPRRLSRKRGPTQHAGERREPQRIAGGAEKFRASDAYKQLVRYIPNLDEVLQQNGALIAGGSVLKSVVPGEQWYTKADIDIYVPIPNDKPFNQYFRGNRVSGTQAKKASGYCRSFLRRNGIRYVKSVTMPLPRDTYGSRALFVDIMAVRKRTTPLQVVQNFDLTFCQVWYDGRDVYATHPDHIEQKSGELQGDYVPIYFSGNTFLHRRVRKYLGRGFKIRANTAGVEATQDLFRNLGSMPLLTSRCNQEGFATQDGEPDAPKGITWARKTLFYACMGGSYRQFGTYHEDEDGYDSEDYVKDPELLVALEGGDHSLLARKFGRYLYEIEEYFRVVCNSDSADYGTLKDNYFTPLASEAQRLFGDHYRRLYGEPVIVDPCREEDHYTTNNNHNQNNNNNNSNTVHNTRENLPPLPTRPMITGSTEVPAPTECFDPYMASTVDIADNQVLFYIFNKPAAAGEEPTLAAVSCIDNETEENGRSVPLYTRFLQNDAYLYYRCKPTVPQGALFVQRDQVEPEPLRRLAFDRNIYVYEKQAKQIKAGGKYALIPTEAPVGRIVSQDLLRGGTAVGAEHCQTTYTDKVYEIYEMTESGAIGGALRRRRRVATRRRPKRHQSRRRPKKN